MQTRLILRGILPSPAVSFALETALHAAGNIAPLIALKKPTSVRQRQPLPRPEH